MQHSLAISSTDCAKLLNELSSLLDDPKCEHRLVLAQTAVEDQGACFRIWAGSLGAFQQLSSLASLDHRLRESRKVASHVQVLLQDLRDPFKDRKYLALVVFSAYFKQCSRSSLETGTIVSMNERKRARLLVRITMTVKGNVIIGQELTSPIMKGVTHRLESEELYESIKETIVSLFPISIITRKPSPTDSFAKALSVREGRFAEADDIDHVGLKFPALEAQDKRCLLSNASFVGPNKSSKMRRYGRKHVFSDRAPTSALSRSVILNSFQIVEIGSTMNFSNIGPSGYAPSVRNILSHLIPWNYFKTIFRPSTYIKQVNINWKPSARRTGVPWKRLQHQTAPFVGVGAPSYELATQEKKDQSLLHRSSGSMSARIWSSSLFLLFRLAISKMLLMRALSMILFAEEIRGKILKKRPISLNLSLHQFSDSSILPVPAMKTKSILG